MYFAFIVPMLLISISVTKTCLLSLLRLAQEHRLLFLFWVLRICTPELASSLLSCSGPHVLIAHQIQPLKTGRNILSVAFLPVTGLLMLHSLFQWMTFLVFSWRYFSSVYFCKFYLFGVCFNLAAQLFCLVDFFYGRTKIVSKYIMELYCNCYAVRV